MKTIGPDDGRAVVSCKPSDLQHTHHFFCWCVMCAAFLSRLLSVVIFAQCHFYSNVSSNGKRKSCDSELPKCWKEYRCLYDMVDTNLFQHGLYKKFIENWCLMLQWELWRNIKTCKLHAKLTSFLRLERHGVILTALAPQALILY